MRKRVCVGLLALSFIASLAAGAAPASARSLDSMRAQIQFDFHIEETQSARRGMADAETVIVAPH
jgi:hypothetical protein